MDNSSTSTHEKDSHDPVSSTSSPVQDEGPKGMGANISRETADEAQQVDLEKVEEKKAPTPGGFNPADFPDGGTEAWLVVSGGFACLFSSFGWINAIGVFQTEWEKNQLRKYTPSDIAWIPSLEVFMMSAGAGVVGKLYDNYGPRWILLLGSFLHVFGLMMSSISATYYQFILSQGICSPIGACMIFYPAMSCVSTWFFKRRAYAFGIMVSGSSLGGVIFPIMVQRIIGIKDFGWAMRASAFLILGLQIYANLTLKSRLPPRPTPWRILDFIKPYTELPFALTAVAAFLFFFGMFLPFTFIILSAESNGMSAYLAGYLLSILNAASIVGRVLPGFIGDKVGRYNTMIVMTFLSTIFVLAMWLPARGNVVFILFAVFFGFSSGAFISLAPSLVAQISDIRQIGVRTGAMFMLISIASLTGSPIGGQLLVENKGKYDHLCIFCGTVMAAGSCVFVAARWSLQGFKPVKV